jgi:hypothetical protein
MKIRAGGGDWVASRRIVGKSDLRRLEIGIPGSPDAVPSWGNLTFE